MNAVKDRIVGCECGAYWSVNKHGSPMSWLGRWAEAFHSALGHRFHVLERREDALG